MIIDVTKIPAGMSAEGIITLFKQRGIMVFDSDCEPPAYINIDAVIKMPDLSHESVVYFYQYGEKYKTHSGLLFRLTDAGEYQGKSFEVYEEVKNFSWK